MHRYNDITYIMNLDIEDGLDLINTAYQKDAEDRLWQQWLVDYSHMDKENFMSFENYKNKVFKNESENNRKIDIKEIIDEAEAIKNLDQKKGGT